MYFDILGLVMLTYRDSAAKLLHAVPAALALGLPLLTAGGAAISGSRPGSGSRSRSGGSGNGGPLGPAYVALAGGALRTLGSILLAVGLPVLLGVARTLISGGPHIFTCPTHLPPTQPAFDPRTSVSAPNPLFSHMVPALFTPFCSNSHYLLSWPLCGPRLPSP